MEFMDILVLVHVGLRFNLGFTAHRHKKSPYHVGHQFFLCRNYKTINHLGQTCNNARGDMALPFCLQW